MHTGIWTGAPLKLAPQIDAGVGTSLNEGEDIDMCGCVAVSVAKSK